MKDRALKDYAKKIIESQYGLNENEDIQRMIDLFVDGYSYALQQINENDHIKRVLRTENLESAINVEEKQFNLIAL